jgi:Ca2+-binding EF-hand superfamily protein
VTFGASIQAQGHFLPDQTLTALVAVVDSNGDATIDFTEYLGMMDVLNHPEELSDRKDLAPEQASDTV